VWDKQAVCEPIADAKSCQANEAQYSCYWKKDENYCNSFSWFNCDKGPSSAGCKIEAARNATSQACSKITVQTACDAADTCQWSSKESACSATFMGTLLALKQLGSKVATPYMAQQKTCNSLWQKKSCIAAPPRETATTSYALGQGCDWYGNLDADPPQCLAGTKFANVQFAGADNDIDK
jgi:hypothetical protein